MSSTSATPSKVHAKSQLANPKIDIRNELDREKMISDAAYFRAVNRGFEAGDTLADWLAAEADIDAVLKRH